MLYEHAHMILIGAGWRLLDNSGHEIDRGIGPHAADNPHQPVACRHIPHRLLFAAAYRTATKKVLVIFARGGYFRMLTIRVPLVTVPQILIFATLLNHFASQPKHRSRP
jgi:hypothetical protein